MARPSGSSRIALAIEPLDTLFFRDGRPFEAGTRGASSALPWPQTVAGALRSALLDMAGCDFAALGSAIRGGLGFAEAASRQGDAVARAADVRFRGPWFAMNDEIMVSAPATLQRDRGIGGELVRFDPLGSLLPGWTGDDSGRYPLWPRKRARTEALGGHFITLAGLRDFLAGRTPPVEALFSPTDLYGYDRRTGVSVNAARQTAEDGLLYGVSLLALKEKVSIVVEAEGPAAALDIFPNEFVAPMGGEGRHVLIRRRGAVRWPTIPSQDGRRLLMLVTPGVFDGGWRPEGLSCAAAAVPQAQAVSGWDLARGGPKPTRFVVPAGAVYFLEGEAPVGLVAGNLSGLEDAALGWGCFVEGVWNHV